MHRLFTSLEKETKEPIDAAVTGTIPEWVEGSLYRVGPGKYDIGEDTFNHMFDGLAVAHRFHISNGKASYMNRFLDTEIYRKSIEANRIAVTTFGTIAYPDPCKNVFQRFFSRFDEGPKDNTNVAMFPFGDTIICTSETNKVVPIDPKTLETKEIIDLTNFGAIYHGTAHPHIEADGTIHHLGSTRKKGYCYAFFKYRPLKEGEKIATENGKTAPSSTIPDIEIVSEIKPQWRFTPSYYHSFGFTDNYYVFVEQPLVTNVFNLLSNAAQNKPKVAAIQWLKDHPTKIHIVDRHTGKEVNEEYTYKADTFMCLHHVNAYEENGQIVVDMCNYDADKADFFLYTYLKNFRTERKPGERYGEYEWAHIQRFVLPVDLKDKECGTNLVTVPNTKATAEMKTEKKTKIIFCKPQEIARDLEMPTINYSAYNSKKYNYTYAVAPGEDNAVRLLKKINVQTGEVVTWTDDLCSPSEPIFVAAPGARDEDEGVVLSLVLTTHEVDRYAFLLVLDGKTFKEIARAKVNIEIPQAIHGLFLPHV